MSGQRHRGDIERGLLLDLAHDGLFQRFAGLDHAAGQGVDAERRLAGAAHDQHLAVAQDCGADGEKRTFRIKALVGQAGGSVRGSCPL